jgi:hypothetical protein
MGLPFVTSADLVSAYPGKSVEIADYVDGLIPLLAMTQNAQTGLTYSFVLTDFTKLVTLNNGAAVAVTLPLQATVAWPTGTQLRILNVGAGVVTVAGAVGVTINGSPLTLAQYKGANLIKTGTNTWVFIPFASGVGAAVFSDTPTGTYTGFAYKTFSSGTSTLTVTTAGFADLVVLGGGGGGSDTGYGGGGAGGVLQVTNAYLPAGSLTVIVGAGGPSGGSGGASKIDSYTSPGGGNGGPPQIAGGAGGSGGGGGYGTSTVGGTALAGLGFNGGGSTSGAATAGGGGGGGAAAVGASTTNGVGGAGGAGTGITLAGTNPLSGYSAGTYDLGGGGGAYGDTSSGAGGSGGGGGGASPTGTAGAANKGAGGGAKKGNGGSGLVIVRVAV